MYLILSKGKGYLPRLNGDIKNKLYVRGGQKDDGRAASQRYYLFHIFKDIAAAAGAAVLPLLLYLLLRYTFAE